MEISFRNKLLLIVGTATLALVSVLIGSALIGGGQTRQLDDVEERLVPRLELRPRLQAEFERLAQELQNAVAAQDASALEATIGSRDRLLDLITSAQTVFDASTSAALRRAIQDYYTSARDVSRRLIDGETGEHLVEDIAEMQGRQAKAQQLLKQTTTLKSNELAASFATMRDANRRADRFRLAIGLGGLVLLMGLSLWAGRSVFTILNQLSQGFSRFATGDFTWQIPVTNSDELGNVARDANQMAASLQRLNELRDHSDWLKAGLAGLSDELRVQHEPASLARRILGFLARRIGAPAAALYVTDEEGELELLGHYALGRESAAGEASSGASPVSRFRAGEGLVGEAALSGEMLVVSDPAKGSLRIRSGLAEGVPSELVFLPLTRLGATVGVVELALFSPLSESSRELLGSVREMLAVALEAASSRAALRVLLQETQEQAERLTAQEEELRLNNQELQAQQEELRRTNEELEAQRSTLSDKNDELEDARRRVQQKAEELARVSSYKSQFLANMSHELRTPLNSMLVLSHLLAENEGNGLSPRQVEYAQTIHSAGEDLLGLINQVLDLAKIEAGRQELHLESVPLQHFADYARRVFAPLAADKGLSLIVEISPELPAMIYSDRQRVERILTNLLGNAIKFTDQGEVALRVGRPAPQAPPGSAELGPERCVAFVVSDSGIGIAEKDRERVFAPFEQLDSHSDRRYAGTGLGLTIARECAVLLGGELRLTSSSGHGTTFTCVVPERSPAQAQKSDRPNEGRDYSPSRLADDRENLDGNESHLLIIEDDAIFAEQLIDVIHARGFKVLVASTGAEGLRLAETGRPRGIILDVKLPDIDGWKVMERLQQTPATQAIPVHFVSAVEGAERGLALGAVGYLTKPATHIELANVVRALTLPSVLSARRILVVEDDEVEGRAIVELLLSEGIEGQHVRSAGAALEILERESFGCIVLDLGLPDMDGLELLETLRARAPSDPPRVVVHTGRALTKNEARQLDAYTEAVILKDGSSDTRLLEEIRLFLRHVRQGLPRKEQRTPSEMRPPEVGFGGMKILLAEDDMRTAYAISALLSGKGAQVLVADNGREALEMLARHADVRGVLMDIMMPEMDGYEAMRRLRRDPRFASLPVIALTAKAMKGERERCVEAGANAYLAKPVDHEQLLGALRSWCHAERSDDPGRA